MFCIRISLYYYEVIDTDLKSDFKCNIFLYFLLFLLDSLLG